MARAGNRCRLLRWRFTKAFFSAEVHKASSWRLMLLDHRSLRESCQRVLQNLGSIVVALTIRPAFNEYAVLRPDYRDAVIGIIIASQCK